MYAENAVDFASSQSLAWLPNPRRRWKERHSQFLNVPFSREIIFYVSGYLELDLKEDERVVCGECKKGPP